MIDDPKEAGIRLHAFRALEHFLVLLDRTHRTLEDGWQIYDAKELIDAANASLPFLDKRISEALEDAVRPAEGFTIANERGFMDDYQRDTGFRAIAILIVGATLGIPDKKVEETKPTLTSTPTAPAANEIPFLKGAHP